MKFARLASRVAVGGVTAALATAGLVTATTTSGSAATVLTTNYTCAVPTLGDRTFPVTVDLALPVDSAPAGFFIPAGLLSFNSTITVPSDAEGLLEFVGATGGKSDDFGAAFGDIKAPASVKWDTKTPAANPGDPTVYSGKGANADFNLPQAGSYDVTMPKSFTLTATKADGSSAGSLTCSSATPAKIGSITLTKQSSKTKAKAPKTAKKGSPVTLKVKVKDDLSAQGGTIPTGKLIVKDGKVKVGKGKLKNGKAKIKVKGLKVGMHSLTVIYKGDGYNTGSKSKPVKVKVS